MGGEEDEESEYNDADDDEKYIENIGNIGGEEEEEEADDDDDDDKEDKGENEKVEKFPTRQEHIVLPIDPLENEIISNQVRHEEDEVDDEDSSSSSNRSSSSSEEERGQILKKKAESIKPASNKNNIGTTIVSGSNSSSGKSTAGTRIKKLSSSPALDSTQADYEGYHNEKKQRRRKILMVAQSVLVVIESVALSLQIFLASISREATFFAVWNFLSPVTSCAFLLLNSSLGIGTRSRSRSSSRGIQQRLRNATVMVVGCNLALVVIQLGGALYCGLVLANSTTMLSLSLFLAPYMLLEVCNILVCIWLKNSWPEIRSLDQQKKSVQIQLSKPSL